MQNFKQTLRLADATKTADSTALNTDEWQYFFKLKVPAQQQKAFGNGAITGGVENRGILYVSLKDDATTPVQIEGQVRLSVTNANETVERVLMEDRTERLRGSKTDLTTAYHLGETGIRAGEDSYLLAKIKPDSAKTVVDANSECHFPVTTYTK